MVFVNAIGKQVPVDWTVALEGSPRGTTTRYRIYDRPDWAHGYDIVVHNECSADVADPEFIGRILSAHREGRVPAMVIHCAMHSYRAAKVDDMGGLQKRWDSAPDDARLWSEPRPAGPHRISPRCATRLQPRPNNGRWLGSAAPNAPRALRQDDGGDVEQVVERSGSVVEPHLV